MNTIAPNLRPTLLRDDRMANASMNKPMIMSDSRIPTDR